MDAKDRSPRFNRTIPCSNCGEMYSVTYKRCPFCGGPPPRKRSPKKERVAPERETVPTPKEEPSFDVEIIGLDEVMAETRSDFREEPAPAQLPVEPSEEAEDGEETQGEGWPAIEEDAWMDIKAEARYEARAEMEEEYWTGRGMAVPEDGAAKVKPRTQEGGGGRRLQKSGPNMGRIVLLLLSLVIVVFAAFIVVTKVVPVIQARFGGGEVTQGGQQSDGQTDPVLEGFGIHQSNVTLYTPGETIELTTYDTTGYEGGLTWESSHPDIVAVTDEGKLIAASPGSAVITVTRGDGETASCNVECSWTSASYANWSLNRVDFTLNLRTGETFQMLVSGTDEMPNWYIQDESVATISETGLVTPVGVGSTVITAEIGEAYKTCTLYIKNE